MKKIILSENDFNRLLKQPVNESEKEGYSEIDNDDDMDVNDIDDGDYLEISLFDAVEAIDNEDIVERLQRILGRHKLTRYYKVYINGSQITDDSDIQNALDEVPQEVRDVVEYYTYQEIERQIKRDKGMDSDFLYDDDELF